MENFALKLSIFWLKIHFLSSFKKDIFYTKIVEKSRALLQLKKPLGKWKSFSYLNQFKTLSLFKI
jgi:hypothetical protein